MLLSKASAEYKTKVIEPKLNKFNAKKTEYNGYMYDSKKESNYAKKLDVLINSGDVVCYDKQVKYRMIVNGFNCGYYKLDFKVLYPDGHFEYVDVKGHKSGATYAIFRLKKKIVQALYGIEIIEV